MRIGSRALLRAGFGITVSVVALWLVLRSVDLADRHEARVDDCAVALAAVKANGHRVIDEEPRPGSRGTTVAFVHPKTAFGTLIELVQE